MKEQDRKDVLEKVRGLLRENEDEAAKLGSGRFFKPNETINVYGVKMAVVSKIGKSVFAGIKTLPKDDIFDLCGELWVSGYMEEIAVACIWSHAVHKQYLPADLAVFERWIDAGVHNWAACDSLCNHTVGTFLEMYPEFVAHLKDWARETNRWKQRAAAVSLIVPARKGLFLSDIFEIVDILLPSPDDLVRKGYGWMLKAASEAHQDEVFAFVTARKTTMPRTAFRYALEKMPPERRAEAMKK